MKEAEIEFRNAVTCLTRLGLLDWLLKGTNSEAESSKEGNSSKEAIELSNSKRSTKVN